jgi:predicted Zn finger-like uncharacterized protein
MNNACPSCGAVYAVAPKDIGRTIRCKKCSAGLRVDDTGLVEDEAAASENEADEGAPRAKKRRFTAEDRAKLAGVLDKIGGVPAALFGLGVFLTIWFFFQQTISAPNGASDNSAKASAARVKLDMDQEVRKLEDGAPEQPEGDDAKAMEEYANKKREFDKGALKKRKEIEKKYRPKLNDANDDYARTQISSAKGLWWDQYGLMFGFLFLSFGCVAYLRTDGNLVLRIVAGTILTLLFLVIFGKFSGCRGMG